MKVARVDKTIWKRCAPKREAKAIPMAHPEGHWPTLLLQARDRLRDQN